MGSSFKKAIFEEHIHEGIVDWARLAKKNKGMRRASNGSTQEGPKEASIGVELADVGEQHSLTEQRLAGEIKPAAVSDNDGSKPLMSR